MNRGEAFVIGGDEHLLICGPLLQVFAEVWFN